MKHKKLLSAVLACALALSLAAPAFAAGAASSNTYKETDPSSRTSYEIDLDGQFYSPTVRVVVTYAGSKLYVNPTKGLITGVFKDALKDAFDGSATGAPTSLDAYYTLNKETTGDNQINSRGIISTPILIRSDTAMALNVYATGTVKVPDLSEIELVADATASEVTGTTKKAASLEIGGSTNISVDTLADPDTGIKDSNYKFPTQFVIVQGESGAPVKQAKIENPVLVASVSAVDPDDKASNFTMVQARGDLNSNDGVVWKENDTVDMSLVLTFSLATKAATYTPSTPGSP